MVNTCWWTLVTFNTFASGPLIPLYFNTFSYNTFSYNTIGRYTGKVEGQKRVLRAVSDPEACTNLVQLHAALKVWEDSIEESTLMSQTYTDEQLQLYLEKMYTCVQGLRQR